jgi:hypothetical protein
MMMFTAKRSYYISRHSNIDNGGNYYEPGLTLHPGDRFPVHFASLQHELCELEVRAQTTSNTLPIELLFDCSCKKQSKPSLNSAFISRTRRLYLSESGMQEAGRYAADHYRAIGR